MKRDMQLILRILEVVEANPSNADDIVAVEGYQLGHVQAHVRMLDNGGFLVTQRDSERGLLVHELTWRGHDYLDMLRRTVLNTSVLTELSAMVEAAGR
jgi:hypothetical protein